MKGRNRPIADLRITGTRTTISGQLDVPHVRITAPFSWRTISPAIECPRKTGRLGVAQTQSDAGEVQV